MFFFVFNESPKKRWKKHSHCLKWRDLGGSLLGVIDQSRSLFRDRSK